MKIAGIIAGVIAVELILILVFIHSGIYNVSTASPDPRFLRWIFSRTSDNSVEHHSKGIAVPGLTDTAMIREGFEHYNDMCVGCHGAPGVRKDETGLGLYPHGPNLAHSAKEMSPAELFWVAKNGIKSTGMPGFGKTHSDQKIWAMVAFLEKMKDMDSLAYASMKVPAQSGNRMSMTMVKNRYSRKK